ncbi:hypothetical protein BB561_006628 [Smittium simulii]|uniref:Uncharacterized protein n=1 Tax=Smittium simulii TaxID=133385 RepID=A0A2T9Y2R2_9FUNG|nr:hypothetical protein BB561_006628 [Smittium simulii]
MNRLFGSANPQEPKPTIDDAITKAESSVTRIKEKISGYNGELLKYQKQLAGMREGPTKNSIRQRATRVLQQRKLYDQQLEQLEQQTFNLESAKFTSENLKNTMTTIQSMEQTNKMLKKQYKNIDNLQDEMADIMEETNEIQQIMGRSYAIPESLEALGAEWSIEQEKSDTLPSYLDDSEKTNSGLANSELDKELEDLSNNLPKDQQPLNNLVGEMSK